jgi:hypothetical protein
MKTISAKTYRGLASEHADQAALIERLRLDAKVPLLCFAIPNAARRSPRVAARMKAEGLTAGVADLCIMLTAGRSIWLEMKTKLGRMSLEQRAFRAVCDALGHTYLVPRSLDDAVELLREHGVLK